MLSVIIPTFNEETIILESLQLLRGTKTISEIIVVDNGSTDNTVTIVQSAKKQDKRIVLAQLDHPSFGDAIREGARVARGDQIVLLNADWVDVDFISRALPLLKSNDIVIGSKVLDKQLDRRPLVRKILSNMLTKCLTALFGFSASDSHGLKAWSKRANSLWLETTQNELIETEYMLKAYKAKLSIAEIPVAIEESRAPRISIYKRAVRMLRELWVLYKTKESL